MVIVNMFPRITTNVEVFHGVAMVRDTGIPVYRIPAQLGSGMSWTEILDTTGVEPQDIREALLYASAVLQGAVRRAALLEKVLQADRPILDALSRHERTILG
jgi:uncharacterized protein (DUF433 family)